MLGYSLLPKNSDGCPFLILAPMEGVGDECFRKAIASIGGFDEAVRDFLRVPTNAHVKSLAVRYTAEEIAPFPLAAQLMGSDPQLMADMAVEMEARGAKRIDLNCGCPSNTVTGRGAGSSLLKEPHFLHEIAKAMVKAVKIPVTAKLRSGFEDTSLFKENLLAAQESGIAFLTLHPRTKVDGYGPPARWDLIAEAKKLLKIPVVGNGDILNVTDALRMLKETACDALMIGRGSVINPFIFHEIKAHFSGVPFQPKFEELVSFFNVYLKSMNPETPGRTRTNKVKQLLSYQFRGSSKLEESRQQVLQLHGVEAEALLDHALPILQRCL